MTLVVLLDLSATFATVDHSILLDRLLGVWIEGLAVSWFPSFRDG